MHARVRTPLRPAPLLACLVGLACNPAIAPAPTIWEATLTSDGSLTGTVAAMSGSDRIEAGISIAAAEPGATYAWELRSGTCDDPGEIVGGPAVYPTLTASDSGTATAETVIAGVLDAAGTYHAGLLTGADNATRVACGALVRR